MKQKSAKFTRLVMSTQVLLALTVMMQQTTAHAADVEIEKLRRQLLAMRMHWMLMRSKIKW